jgi:hypothetical protein
MAHGSTSGRVGNALQIAHRRDIVAYVTEVFPSRTMPTSTTCAHISLPRRLVNAVPLRYGPAARERFAIARRGLQWTRTWRLERPGTYFGEDESGWYVLANSGTEPVTEELYVALLSGGDFSGPQDVTVPAGGVYYASQVSDPGISYSKGKVGDN